MEKEGIDISIIVSVWTRHKFLIDALQSIVDQDYEGKTQVILIDDGSLDGTTKVIESFKDRFDKFDVIRENPPREARLKTSRLAIMINKVLPLCDGDYISYLCDDDLYKPERNRLMIKYLDENPDIFFAYHWMKMILISEDKAVVGTAVDLCDKWGRSMKYWVENIYNRIDHNSFLHRNLGKNNILWDENPVYKRCTDWGFVLKVLAKDLKVGCIEKHLAIGRKIQGMSLNLNGDSMIANMTEKGQDGDDDKKKANILH